MPVSQMPGGEAKRQKNRPKLFQIGNQIKKSMKAWSKRGGIRGKVPKGRTSLAQDGRIVSLEDQSPERDEPA
jgi:hypothetical protein